MSASLAAFVTARGRRWAPSLRCGYHLPASLSLTDRAPQTAPHRIQSRMREYEEFRAGWRFDAYGSRWEAVPPCMG